ncbi:hypothetical protein QJR60_11855 [Paraclostridium sordellii]|uniref:hypothetical protein n=1 Tax=Paraclostridium sordellii TaxID=1505 RepID=UPI0030D04149
MDKQNKHNLKDISKYLIDEFKAIEINNDEFLEINPNLTLEDLNSNSKILKITDETLIQNLLTQKEKEEIEITIHHFNKNFTEIDHSSYDYKISTGKLITIILECDDDKNLSGFIMDGSGELLYNYLLTLIGEDIEKSINPLDEVIEELIQFRPYGKYFK